MRQRNESSPARGWTRSDFLSCRVLDFLARWTGDVSGRLKLASIALDHRSGVTLDRKAEKCAERMRAES